MNYSPISKRKWTKPFTVVVMVLFIFAASNAQAFNPPAVPAPEPQSTSATNSEGKSISGAYGRSALHTLGSIGLGIVLSNSDWIAPDFNIAGGLLIGYGFFFGPSAGNFYANDAKNAWIGIGSRAGGTLLTIIGVAMSLCTLGDGCSEGHDTRAEVTALSGLALASVGTVYHLASIPKGIRKLEGRTSRLSVAPTLSLAEGRKRIGMDASLTF